MILEPNFVVKLELIAGICTYCIDCYYHLSITINIYNEHLKVEEHHTLPSPWRVGERRGPPLSIPTLTLTTQNTT